GGGGHHGGGGGGFRRGGGRGFVGGGGGWWGPGGYAAPLLVDNTAVRDVNGNCICEALNPDGSCARPVVGWIGGRPVFGLGADEASSATPWIAGGILVALAVGAFALDKKGPTAF